MSRTLGLCVTVLKCFVIHRGLYSEQPKEHAINLRYLIFKEARAYEYPGHRGAMRIFSFHLHNTHTGSLCGDEGLKLQERYAVMDETRVNKELFERNSKSRRKFGRLRLIWEQAAENYLRG